MGKTYLLDTNIVIYILNGTLQPEKSVHLQAASESEAIISVISKIELLGWTPSNQQEATLLEKFVSGAIVSPLSDEVIDKTIELRRTCKIKLPDAIIAATALVNDQILLTRNETDFEKIKDLLVINPFVRNEG